VKLTDFSILFSGVLLNALAQLGLKAATRVTGPLLAGDAGVWLVGLSRVPVTQAYPLLSLGYVINIGLAWWLLGEVPNAQRVAGVAVIVVGVILVARS